MRVESGALRLANAQATPSSLIKAQNENQFHIDTNCGYFHFTYPELISNLGEVGTNDINKVIRQIWIFFQIL